MKANARRFSLVLPRLLGLAAVLLIAAPPYAGAQQAIGGLRIERTGHTATRLPGGKILVVGGENANGPVRDSEVFDPASRTFSAATGLLAARAEHTATSLADGRLFVIGGRTFDRLLDSTEIYDPETASFSSGPGLNHARAGHTATLLPDGRIVVIGGDADGTVEVFDTQAGTFRLIEARLAVPRRSHAAALLKDGMLLIAGGVASDGSVLTSAELLDTETLSFLSISPSMRVARSRPTLRVLPDGKVQAIGGDPDATMELFNPAGRYFTSLAHPASNPDLLSAALKTQTRAAVIGHRTRNKLMGLAEANSSAADELLDRTRYSLTEIPELNEALAAGGARTSGQLKTTAALLSSSSATVTTDKTDYAPGDTVIITGTGWQPGETVNLNIHRDTGDPPDTLLTAVADADGNIQNTDYVVQDFDIGVTFLLTATGQSSGYTAQTAFTDGNVKAHAAPAGATFTLIKTQYSTSSNCTTGAGAPTTVTGVNTSSGNTTNVPINQSIKLQAAATSDQGGTFLNWTSTDPFTNVAARTICVAGFTSGGARDYAANYAFVAADNASVTVNEGQTAGNTGTYSDSAAAPTITASVGTVTKTGTTSGTWSWSYNTTDGPAQSQTVTITSNDGAGGTATTTFSLTVNNVAPTATFTGPASVNEGSTTAYSFSGQSDPSTADTAAGFHYAYACAGGSLSGATYAGSGTSTSTNCTFPDGPATVTVRARIIDKDDGFTEYTVSVTVNNVAPTAVLSNNGPVNEGSPVTISFASQSDPSTADTTAGFHYAFSCTNGPLGGANYGSSGTSVSTSCTFPDGPATATVRARIIDKDNGFTEYQTTVTVNNVAPTVNTPAVTPEPSNEGSSVTASATFSDPGTNDAPFTCTVNYGDGSGNLAGTINGSTCNGPAHTYADNGSFTVTVSVTDKDGGTGSKSTLHTVNNVAPTVNTAVTPEPSNEASSATASATFSDPGTSDGPFTCTVNYGDGSGTLAGTVSGTTCNGPAHTYADNGTFTVTVSVTDKDGGTGSKSISHTVNNVAPTATFAGPATVNEGSPATYSFSGAFDPSTPDTAAGFHYAFKCDGTSLAQATYAGSGTSTSVSCTFPDGPATAHVRARIIDKDDGFTEYTATVTVVNVAPVLTAAANQTADEGTSKSFSLGSFTDPGADNPWAVVVAWGDASSNTTFNATATGALAGQSHTYADNGTYTVSVTVTDKDGAPSNTATFQVTVANAPPTATLGNNGPINEGGSATVSFTGQSDPSSADTAAGFHYAFSCTNGDLSAATYGSSGTAASTICSFDDNGSKTVKGRIIDKDNGFTEYTTTVVVNNVAPTAALGNNGPVNEGSAALISFSAQFDSSSADAAAGFHYAFSCANGDLSGATYAGSGTSASTGCTFPDGPVTAVVKARIIDKDNGFTEYTTSVTVNNVAPVLTAAANQTADQGTAKSFDLGSFTDPGADNPWAVDVDWGDSTAHTTFNATATGTLAGQTHTYVDSGTFTVSVKVTDKDVAASNTATFQVTVTNAPPTAALGNNGPVNEGSAATITFTDQSDSPSDTAAGFHYAYSCANDDLSAATYADSGTNASTTCTFNDNGSFVVKARIIDQHDGFTEYTTTVLVNNVAPTGTLGNNGPVNEGSAATVSFGSQFDPSTVDTTTGFHYAFSCTNGSLAGATYAGSSTSASTSCTFPDGPATATVRARIIDKDDGFTEYTTSVTVNNVAPVMTAAANQTADEGTSKSFSLGSFTDPGTDNPWAVVVTWGDASPNTSFIATAAGALASQSHTYGDNGTYTVSVVVTDKDSAASNTVTFTITVANVPPTATLSNNGSINEGGSATVSFSAQFDPSPVDTAAGFRYAFSCANSSLAGATYAGSGMSVSTSCPFNDNGNFPVRARIIDKDDGFTEYTTTVGVNNVAPTATFAGAASANEGSPTAYAFSAQFDPSTADTSAGFHYAYACDGSSLALATYASANGGTSASVSCTFPDGPATVTVRARIIDKDNGFTEYTTSVAVNNVAPAITGVTGPSGPISVQSNSATITATFTDAGSLDTHTCTFSWDGDAPDTLLNAAGTGNGSCSTTHSFATAGVYTIGVTVTDKDGATATSKFEFVVVYDPSAGFVTGGGWINSPPEAYTADPTLTGKANFGFVSKYQKGATIPTGETEFEFHAGSFDFHSSAYQWLVISGPLAQYKGSGTVNGAGDYGFLLTARDGQVSGGGGVDKFRIKVWDNNAGGAIVYDNASGSDDINTSGATALAGGSIVIHK